MKTVLLVENNELSRKLLARFIELNHYTPIVCESAEEALQIVKHKKPDMILMDIMLPGLDGISATKLLKADPLLKDVPVIVLSAYAMKEDKEKAFLAGCSDYIVKPVELSDFSAMLKKYLK